VTGNPEVADAFDKLIVHSLREQHDDYGCRAIYNYIICPEYHLLIKYVVQMSSQGSLYCTVYSNPKTVCAAHLLKRISTAGLSRKKQSDPYIYPKVSCACTWLSPPRSGPSPHLHNHSCHHLVSCDICSPSPLDWDIGLMIATGGGIRGEGRDNGFGGGG
jgi:hypothetical protein